MALGETPSTTGAISLKETLAFDTKTSSTNPEVLPDYSKSTVFNVRWSHSKDAKSSPNSTFSASVNFGSSDYYRQSVNQLNSPNFLNNNLSSSISYSKSFPAYPTSQRISLTTAMSQNSQSKAVNLTLPNLPSHNGTNLSFCAKSRSKKRVLSKHQLSSTQAEPKIELSPPKTPFLDPTMFE